MANVRDILTTSAFEQAKVIAGQDGLANAVKTITVAEVPDAAEWLRGGEIVCTTGFFVRDSSVSQVQWIESLIQHNAAALAIKTTRFLGEVSEAVKLLANTKNFPIISLPGDSTWPTVIESVMNLITDEQLKQLRRAEEIHTQLTQLVLEGNSVSDIAQSLANLVGNPIIVEDGRFKRIAASLPNTRVTNTQDEESLQNAVEKRTDKQFQETLLHSEYYRRVLTGRTKEVLTLTLSKSNPTNSITIPILASNVVYGFLTLIEATGLHTTTDMIALEHGATTIALQLVKNIVQDESHRAKAQESIQALIHGRLHTASLRNQFLPAIDWSLPMAVILVHCALQPVDEDLFFVDKPERALQKIIQKQIHSTFGECIIGYERNLFTILVPFHADSAKQVQTKLTKAMENCLSELQRKLSPQKINIAIGGIYTSRTQLQKSYEDAQKTLEILETMPSLGPITSFERIGIHRLIHMIKDPEALMSFRNDFLLTLIEHDDRTSDSLCQTLCAYLQMSGNITATAKHLFVHPNTVTYRIRKIQQIIGDPMSDPQYRGSLLFALEVDKYLRIPKK